MTLTEFLLARIADDEADAHALAKELGRWEREREWNGPDGTQGSIAVTAIFGTASDPQRVLGECEAKRRIVGDRRLLDTFGVPSIFGERILRALALPYADHPDYREEWAQ